MVSTRREGRGVRSKKAAVKGKESMYKSFTRKSRALCLFLTLVGPAVGLAQPSDDRANAEALDALAADWAQRFEDEHAAALDWAKQQRWENTWIEHPEG
ncbi:MAG: hypothetical protein IIC51_02585, partial [Planctomycetes bacterium]|nr:hypothetical protein [Planctomycetota bacterium]